MLESRRGPWRALQVGTPLPWPSSLPHLRRVRRDGVEQFLHILNRLKDITQDDLLWGDEIECGIFKVGDLVA
jgi:hypothetical protein